MYLVVQISSGQKKTGMIVFDLAISVVRYYGEMILPGDY